MSDAINRLAQALADVLAQSASSTPVATAPAPESWRVKLWTVPPDTRLSLAEVCEALGKGRGGIYKLTRRKQIPHRLLDGRLSFRAGDVREWVARREQVVVTTRLTDVKGKDR